MFNVTPVFHANFNATEKIVINQGGTSSSKTYSIMQLLFLKAITTPKLRITVTGESIPNLKKGAYRDAQSILNDTKDLKVFLKSWNQTDRIFHFTNGSFIEFITNETEQAAKSGKRDLLFMNEANGVNYMIFWQLAMRTEGQIYIDYNPSAPFWAHEQLIGTNGDNDLSASVRLIISDHRHNTFLSESQHKAIEGIKDKDLWQVYARGKTGNLIGLVYPNWRVIPDEDFPEQDFIIGLDFGYTNDPTAMVKITWIGDNVFVKELAYSPGLSAKELSVILKANGVHDSSIWLFTEHDPDMAAQLRTLGFYCQPAKKGPGSIMAGISKLKEFNVFYTASSKNLMMEQKRYMWEIDKTTGKPTNSPIDSYNHLMDAIRYGVYTHFYRKGLN